MKRFAISMKTDWIFDGIEAWINEGNGRITKVWGDSTVAHFACKVRATDTLRSLGRQHGSSLCSQSEGHGHVAKIWGMTLLNFLRVLGRHYIRPPHFASKVSYSASPQTSAECPREAACSHVVHANL